MRITEIRATNFLAHRDLNIVIKPHATVLFIAGDNGVGKTALCTGIKLALTGDPIRGLSLKKDIPKLITEGETNGNIIVDGDVNGIPRSYKLSLKTGNHGSASPPLDGSPLSLEPHEFFALDINARRKVLFEMAGVEVKPSTVTALLIDKGNDLDRVQAIEKYLKLGFDKTAEEAKKLASEARGAWKVHTGENYGSSVAESWRAAAPSFDELPDVDTLKQLVSDLADQEAELKTKAYTLQHAADAHKAAEGATSAIDGLQAARDALQERRDEKERLETNLADLLPSANYTSSTSSSCPHCKTPLAYEKGHLVIATETKPKHDPLEAADAVKELRQKLGDLDARINNLVATVARGEASQELLDNLPAKVDEKDLARAKGLHAAKVGELTVAQTDLNRALSQLQEAEQVEVRTRKARDCHLDVIGYNKLATALVALPQEFLGKTVDTFNALLKEASSGLSKPVQMGQDLELYYGTRPHSMLSESEQWRVHMAMGYAIAVMGGLRLLVLDRFDMVVPKHRGAILKWLAGQDQVQVILAASLKEKPQLPAAFQVEWLG